MTPESYAAILSEIAATPDTSPGNIAECGACGFRWDDLYGMCLSGVPAREGPETLEEVMRDKLNDIMELDHVIMVNSDGTVTDGPDGIHAPESLIDTDDDGQILASHEQDWKASIERQGWETFTDGYSGQDRYRGPIMHASEFIGGRLARDILDTPGLYVAVSVECLPPNDDGETEPAGWAVLRRDLPTESESKS